MSRFLTLAAAFAAILAGPGTVAAEDGRSAGDWWAARPVGHPSVPAAPEEFASWPAGEIDHFILDRLLRNGLTPAPEAAPEVLVRRIFFAVTGLPPGRSDVESYLNDRRPDAWERLVDRLLDSPHYGERLARLWLDLVRYADSDGYKADDYRPDAWRYRDYVIRAFNADRPYSQFVMEQIAGDELFPDNPDALIATGFLRHWIYEYNNSDTAGQWQVILNDITDTTADVFLGVGLQCARCHDHKTDPLRQTDYFSLQAFFAPILPVDDTVVDDPVTAAENARRQADWEAATAEIRDRIAAIGHPVRSKAAETEKAKLPPEIQDILRKPAADRTPLEEQLARFAERQVRHAWDHAQITGSAREEIAALEHQLAAFDSLKPPPPSVAPTVRDVGPAAPPVTIPGRPAAGPVAPAFPAVFNPPAPDIRPTATGTGRRSALARWLASPDNPLTARVIVNRIWQYHFGRGLCGSASDFGLAGGPPSHPELLDWLARRFMEDGWSLKALHRRILTSAAWRQSTVSPCEEEGRRIDPANRLIRRREVRRLDAEQVRDALFAASGELDPAPGGPGVTGDVPRRSIYLRLMRNSRDPLTDLFDTPQQFVSTASRDVTTTPVQALFLSNSPFLTKRAEAMAARLIAAHPDNDAALVEDAWWRVAGREPTPGERADSLGFLQEPDPAAYSGNGEAPADAAAVRLGRVSDFCHVLLNSSALLYVE